MMAIPFFFFVHNRNHVRILLPVAERLRAQGHAVTFVDLEAWHHAEGAVPELRRRREPSVSIADFVKAPPWRAVFVMNGDWAPERFVSFLRRVNRRAFYHLFRRRRIVRVGVVDGCRFAQPIRYTNVDYILAWGPSARSCFKTNVIVTGSPVIEAASARPAAVGPPLVAVNYKFTYHHLDDAGRWTSAVMNACEQIGVPYAFSAHPSNRVAAPQAAPAEDIETMLDRATVLVTAPSTVAYEAMARGTPVVLFPLTGEALFEFGEPMGAFEIASAATLPALIASALRTRDGYAARCRQFLEHHVAMDAGEPADARTAAALATIAAEI